VFICTILRDALPVILEISANIVVIVLLKQYTDRKNRLSNNQQAVSKSNKKVDRDSIILTIIMSLLSTLQHTVAFMVSSAV